MMESVIENQRASERARCHSDVAKTPTLGYAEAGKLGQDTLWLPAWAYWLMIFALYLASIGGAVLFRWLND